MAARFGLEQCYRVTLGTVHKLNNLWFSRHPLPALGVSAGPGSQIFFFGPG